MIFKLLRGKLRKSLGDAHKCVGLASPDRPNFCSKVRVGWSASIKTEKKLKARFISISHLLIIKIGICLTLDNLKSYIPTKSNLPP